MEVALSREVCEATDSQPDFRARVDDVSEEIWSEILGEFADANLYQTWAYGALSWGEHQLSHLVLEQEGTPVALAQLRLLRLPLVRRGVAYVRWGPLCVRSEGTWSEQVYRAMAKALVNEYAVRRRLLLRLVPHVPTTETIAGTMLSILHDTGFRQDEAPPAYRTLRVDLRPDLDQIRKRLAQKWRNQLNAGQRNGLIVREGDDDAQFEIFQRLYDQMMDRKQFETTVSVSAFQRMQQHLPAAHKLRILIAECDQQPVAGLVASTMGHCGIYLLGATSTEGMKCKAAYVLQWRMIERLKELGCAWYDLGGINPERNPGVYHFKSGMGGDDIRFPGRFSVSGGWLSQAAVAGAEHCGVLLRRLRAKCSPPSHALDRADGPTAG